MGEEHIITVMDHALQQQSSNPAPLLLTLNTLRANWNERNLCQFKNKQAFRGIQPILNETEAEIQATDLGDRLSDDRLKHLQKAQQTLQYWKDETHRWHRGETIRRPQPHFVFTPRQQTHRGTPEEGEEEGPDRGKPRLTKNRGDGCMTHSDNSSTNEGRSSLSGTNWSTDT
ncbi:hypothetical protein R1sor_022358 [Riccia sorocarpa]|uniref:Uncharacterized protein n=1 Tax=Riccia sorocarpa TaxID=122646 RepID=A0ABD3GML0_9MARC